MWGQPLGAEELGALLHHDVPKIAGELFEWEDPVGVGGASR